MEILIKLALLFALISFTFLMIYMISSLKLINKSFVELMIKVQSMSKDFSEIKSEAIEISSNVKVMIPKIDKALENLQELSVNANAQIIELNSTRQKTETSLANFDDMSKEFSLLAFTARREIEKASKMVEPIENMMRNVAEKVADPINQTANLVSAVGKGFSAFIGRFRRD